MDELVSVVITTKNEEKNIKNILKSIEIQSYKNIEVIIVDNCSSDTTIKRAEEFPVKILRHTLAVQVRPLFAALFSFTFCKTYSAATHLERFLIASFAACCDARLAGLPKNIRVINLGRAPLPTASARAARPASPIWLAPSQSSVSFAIAPLPVAVANDCIPALPILLPRRRSSVSD